MSGETAAPTRAPLRALVLLVVLGLAACGDEEPLQLLTPAEVAAVDSLLADTVIPAVDPLGYHVDRLDKRIPLRLLAAGQYDSLDALLDERWQAARRDIRHEDRLYNAFEAFFQGNGALQPALTRWATARPTSPHARVGEAYYRYGRAVGARGQQGALATTEAQVEQMRYQIGLGKAAAAEGLRLAPDHLMAHFVRLNFLRLGGGEPDEARAVVEGAIVAHPTSYLLRGEILAMIEPRWGGSLEIMRDFLESSEPLEGQNPKLRSLHGAVPRAEALPMHEDEAMATALLDQASYHGEDYYLALAYGEVARHHGRLVDALRAYQRARAFRPQGRSLLEDRGALLVQIGTYIEDPVVRDRAWAEAERLLRLVRELRIPHNIAVLQLGRLADRRAICRSAPAPCA